jgi:hypothetical protein
MPKGTPAKKMTQQEIIDHVNKTIPYTPGDGQTCIQKRTREIKRLFGVHKIPQHTREYELGRTD